MELAPVVLFTYNRPWHTRKTVESLLKNDFASESNLIVFSDGPKDSKESLASVLEVRRYLRGVSGFKNIVIVESLKNLGLANSVTSGVSDVVNKYGRVIVLEDDLVTAPCFLRYLNQALEKYDNEEQVMQISGHMFDMAMKAESDAIFLPFTTSWGWATWKRAWDHFDQHISGYEKLKNDKRLRHKFDLDGAYGYFNMLKEQRKGKIDSWAVRWYLSIFMAGGLTLFPKKTLVQNIGFDGTGSNGGISGVSGISAPFWIDAGNLPIRFPNVLINEYVYQEVKSILSSKRTIINKLRTLVLKILKILRICV